jgi:UDP-N-acetylmuramoylalanine-D-glutamate ligase
LSIVDAFGVEVQPGLDQLARFSGLPHRLQSLGTVAGIRIIDDSIATVPQATIAALSALETELVSVIVGGFDRDIDWSVFARYLRKHPVHQVITQGDNGSRIASLLATDLPQQTLIEVDDLTAAVEQGLATTPAGGVLLLSPGAPSYGQFEDFQQRGLQFARLAGIDRH